MRFLFNQMLAERKNSYEQHKEDKQRLKDVKYRSPARFKQEHEWLREVDSLALCNAELHLKTAFRNFFRDKRIGYPRFKSRKNPIQSYTTNNQKGTIRIVETGRYIRLPKMGDIRIKLHVVKSATVSQGASGKYHISILTEIGATITTIIPHPEKVLGLDYSSKGLYIDNNGKSANYPKYMRLMETRLKRAQQTLARRSKDGSNWLKQKRRVALLHEKVANQRKDFLHKESRQLAEQWEAIIIEDLNMKDISQSLSLGKATMDNGNGMFRTMLGYKLAERGKTLIRIDKWFPSSKLCRTCGTIHSALKLADRTWTCECCGMTYDRDENAARNIQAEGLRLLGFA